MKSSFKVSEQTWLDTKKEVKHLKTRQLFGYVAYNETPPQICVKVSGPDDRGVQKDIIIDVKSLFKDLQKCGLIVEAE